MYLIADSGSTKTQWCLVRGATERTDYYTSGINAVMMNPEQIVRVLEEEYQGPREGVEAVWFYGAGCGSSFPAATERITRALTAFFGSDRIEATSDLMAAARALCGTRPGVACILGTGANSCFYDGERIVRNVPPLGFILGDEGSGAVMGKKLLADVLKGIFPEDLCRLFYEEYPLDYPTFIEKVYRQPLPLPNRFMAGMTRFLARHIERPEVMALVEQSFGEFVERNVLRYPEARECPVSFTGSIAHYFRPQLEKVLRCYGLAPGRIAQVPMEGLVEYHRSIE